MTMNLHDNEGVKGPIQYQSEEMLVVQWNQSLLATTHRRFKVPIILILYSILILRQVDLLHEMRIKQSNNFQPTCNEMTSFSVAGVWKRWRFSVDNLNCSV